MNFSRKNNESLRLALMLALALSIFAVAACDDETSDPKPADTQDTSNSDLVVPDVTELDGSEPDVTEPDVTEPDVTEPDLTEPDLTDIAEPDVTDVAEPDVIEVPTEEWIGASCACEGNGCVTLGVPVPNGGTIVGCDNVPTDLTGAELVCLRTYVGEGGTKTYFANGYCSLMSVACTGSDVICTPATMGDHTAMTRCPAGSAMVESTIDVNVIIFDATVSNKTCALRCESDADCRLGETDPVLNDAPSQYACVDGGTAKFCYDPRNLPAEYTVTPF